MTGTAMTEADEFGEIYKLDVVEIPPTSPASTNDEDDEVYRTADEKYEAVALLIEDARKRGQQVLVGTTSIERRDDRRAAEQEESAARGVERSLPRRRAESCPRRARWGR